VEGGGALDGAGVDLGGDRARGLGRGVPREHLRARVSEGRCDLVAMVAALAAGVAGGAGPCRRGVLGVDRDIAAGGEVAPLVPAFHAAVFGDPRVHRVIVNLGGIANLTDLPRRGAVTGFDIGPGNVLLDAWIAARLGRAFDRDGALASSGHPREALLKALLDDAYFRRAPPKSTGRDRFNLDWLRSFGVARYKAEDVQATLAELSARSIARAISKSCPGAAEVYLCGGGARNRDLVKRIARALPGVAVATTARLGIHADWVEAMAFAWLAKQRLECATGSLSSVTGAQGPRVLGAVYAG